MGRFFVSATATGFRFLLKAANGQTVAASQVYASRAACLRGVASVARQAPKAPVADLTQGGRAANPRFEVYADRAGEFRFRLTARNGQIIAVSEGYTSRAACLAGVASVRENAREPEILPG